MLNYQRVSDFMLIWWENHRTNIGKWWFHGDWLQWKFNGDWWIHVWLVVYLPLWKVWMSLGILTFPICQLGWLFPKYIETQNMFQTTNQSWIFSGLNSSGGWLLGRKNRKNSGWLLELDHEKMDWETTSLMANGRDSLQQKEQFVAGEHSSSRVAQESKLDLDLGTLVHTLLWLGLVSVKESTND